jgi:RNA polymerase-binding transcription factor
MRRCIRRQLLSILTVKHSGVRLRVVQDIAGWSMNDKMPVSDEAFLNRQQARLLKLQAELSSTARAEESEETAIQNQSLGEAREFEDDAQRLSFLEVEGLLISRNSQRLPGIERALKKIKEGTYGFSDASGQPIPRERLEAVPEAIYTADEEAVRGSTRS